MNKQNQVRQNEQFLKRLIERDPRAIDRYLPLLMRITGGKLPASLRGAVADKGQRVSELATKEWAGSGNEAPRLLNMFKEFKERAIPADQAYSLALETIVRGERPVLFIENGRPVKTGASLDGLEAETLADDVIAASDMLATRLMSVGRIDVRLSSGKTAHLGTGWFVANDVIVTNSHVAREFAERSGTKFQFKTFRDGRQIESLLNTALESEDQAVPHRVFDLSEVLFIHPNEQSEDIAFFRVKWPEGTTSPGPILIKRRVEEESKVCVLGYPGRGSTKDIPDQEWMDEIFQRRYGIKRVSPGLVTEVQGITVLYDSTTLGGHSGSVVLDLATGEAVALHHSGIYEKSNYGLGAGTLARYVDGKLWERPHEIRESTEEIPNKPVPPRLPARKGKPARPPVAPQPPPLIAAGAGQTLTFPLVLTLNLGVPIVGGNIQQSQATIGGPVDGNAVEGIAKIYWDARPAEVLGVRVGYDDEDGGAFLAVSVSPSIFASFAAGQEKVFQGVPVRFFPASAAEQLDAMPGVETGGISYDDEARTGAGFSLEPVEEQVDAIFHVGPEYAWDTLKGFLAGATSSLVSSMYEFHSIPVKKVIEERMRDGVSFMLVLDSATFSGEITNDRFNPREVFESWAGNYNFERIIAPEGRLGLIANSYHMKVTERDGSAFWVSSGNWKAKSSQPVITENERQAARDGTADLPGNRDWHAVVNNRTLAKRLGNHIRQDFQRADELDGQTVPRPRRREIYVDVPLEALEEPVREVRRPPSKVLEPLRVNRTLKIQPLLTPDQEGAVYCEAMLELIETAREQLWFQIPYISMRRYPDQDRGYIDQLIEALCDKLLHLDDARLLLRGGQSAGKEFSSPVHTSWYFRSRGVDVNSRVRRIDDHHTKGMVVDGKRVLIGSHNWSPTGVTLNRDASLLIDDPQVAGYYGEAFEVDWDRSDEIRPRRYVAPEREVREAIGVTPPAGYRRVLLSEWLEGTED